MKGVVLNEECELTITHTALHYLHRSVIKSVLTYARTANFEEYAGADLFRRRKPSQSNIQARRGEASGLKWQNEPAVSWDIRDQLWK